MVMDGAILHNLIKGEWVEILRETSKTLKKNCKITNFIS